MKKQEGHRMFDKNCQCNLCKKRRAGAKEK